MNKELHFRWSCQAAHVHALADFFIRNVSPKYISHGEVMDGRATDFSTWSPDLAKVIRNDFSGAFKSKGRTAEYLRLATCTQGETLMGLALVEFRPRRGMAILHDLVIGKQLRDCGVGGKFLNWIEKQAKKKKIGLLFLESGKKNVRAHEFFKEWGFEVTSLTMVKKLKG